MTISLTNTDNTSATGTSLTRSYTLTAAAQRLIVGFYVDNWPSQLDVNSVTFDGNAMTEIQLADNDASLGRVVGGYSYDTNALGADTGDVVITISASQTIQAVIFCVEADGTVSIGSPTAAQLGSSDSISLSIPSVLGDTVLSFIGWDAIADASVSKDSSQTLVGTNGGSGGGMIGVYSQTGSASSTTSNFSRASADDFGAFGVALTEGGGGSTGTPSPLADLGKQFAAVASQRIDGVLQ